MEIGRKARRGGGFMEALTMHTTLMEVEITRGKREWKDERWRLEEYFECGGSVREDNKGVIMLAKSENREGLVDGYEEKETKMDDIMVELLEEEVSDREGESGKAQPLAIQFSEECLNEADMQDQGNITDEEESRWVLDNV